MILGKDENNNDDVSDSFWIGKVNKVIEEDSGVQIESKYVPSILVHSKQGKISWKDIVNSDWVHHFKLRRSDQQGKFPAQVQKLLLHDRKIP